MATDLDTSPREVDVTTDSVGTWAVSFAAAMTAAGAASITAASATVFLATPPAPESAVAGFVTGATINGQNVNVAWTGAGLTRGKRYRLETRATFNTGRTVELLTVVDCVA